MASKAKAKVLLRGIVKAVPCGDTLAIIEMAGNTAIEIPPERTIILSSLMDPKLARRGGKQSTDKPFAWQNREFLRNLCIGKVHVSLEYSRKVNEGPGSQNRPTTERVMEFGSVFLESRLWSSEDGPPALPAANNQH